MPLAPQGIAKLCEIHDIKYGSIEGPRCVKLSVQMNS